jgi:MFS family permease
VVVSVYAYHHGGATAVGVVMFARMGSAALAAPFMATFADRHEQRRVMLATDVTRVGTVAATAAAASFGSPALVYVLATLTSIISTAFRPAEASLVPQLAETPDELTAANVTSSTFDSVGAFAGPAAGAILYAAGGPTAGFAGVAVAYIWSTLFLARIPHTERPAAPEQAHEERAGIAAGLHAVRGEPRLRLIIGLYSAQTLVAGAYGVLVVVVALQLLDLGNSWRWCSWGASAPPATSGSVCSSSGPGCSGSPRYRKPGPLSSASRCSGSETAWSTSRP